jgi:cyclin A
MVVEHKLQLELISQQQYTGAEPTDPGARMIVVSWMVEVAEEFRLQQETLHMAVLLLDRFLGSVAEVGLPVS